MNDIAQFFQNNHSPTTNFFLFLQKYSLLWYKLSAKLNTDHRLLNTNLQHVHFKTLLIKLASVLNTRTLRDNTEKLDPYKRNLSGFPITTLTHLNNCYDRTYKLLQTFDLWLQRNRIITSKQPALDLMNTVFHATFL